MIALTVITVPTPASAVDGDDPNLNQTLNELAIVHGQRILDAGHVDMGPKYDNGTWRFLIHDDVARADANATSVWRYPDETVLHVFDESKLIVPDDPAYAFLGADPGSSAWVVPQTQNPEVVWLGWNTQDPKVLKTIKRGMTLSLTGVQGPGVVTVYLQSGSFGKPQVLYDSRATKAQPAWVDVNTHTHANWVFTKPGVYLLQLKASADLVDGSTVSDTQLVRFAVGTDTPPKSALAASWNGANPNASSPAPTAADSPAPSGSAAASTPAGSPFVPILIGLIVLVAGGLVAGFTTVVVRGNRTKRRVLAARAPSPASTSKDEEGRP